MSEKDKDIGIDVVGFAPNHTVKKRSKKEKKPNHDDNISTIMDFNIPLMDDDSEEGSVDANTLSQYLNQIISSAIFSSDGKGSKAKKASIEKFTPTEKGRFCSGDCKSCFDSDEDQAEVEKNGGYTYYAFSDASGSLMTKSEAYFITLSSKEDRRDVRRIENSSERAYSFMTANFGHEKSANVWMFIGPIGDLAKKMGHCMALSYSETLDSAINGGKVFYDPEEGDGKK